MIVTLVPCLVCLVFEQHSLRRYRQCLCADDKGTILFTLLFDTYVCDLGTTNLHGLVHQVASR